MTFPVHPALADSTRLPLRVRAGDRLRAADILILMGAGLTAAVLATVLDHGLRIPGHSIAYIKVTDPRSHFCDDPTELMSGDMRLQQVHRTNVPLQEKMHV